MRVLTLTALEDVTTSGPVLTQTLPLLEHFAGARDVSPMLVSFVPAHRRLRSGSRRAGLGNRLARADIPYCEHAIASRSRVYVGPRTLATLRAQCIPRLRRAIDRLNPDVVHARGYVAAHLASALPVPFIFDGRGLYREEAIHVGAWRRGAPADAFWASEERRLIDRAGRFVAVSEAFRKEFPRVDLAVIPCFAPSTPPTAGELPGEVDAFLAQAPTLIYVGSLTSWYNPRPLFDAFSRIAESTPWRIVVITGDLAEARASARRSNVPADRLIAATLRGDEVPRALARSTAAIWAAFGEPTRLHATQLGIKFAEYAAAGRPILVSSSLSTAADLIESHSAGVVLHDADAGTLHTALERVLRQEREMGRAARKLYESTFTLERAAEAYRAVYSAAMSHHDSKTRGGAGDA